MRDFRLATYVARLAATVLLLAAFGLCSQAKDTLHFIYFSDTRDSEIGKNSEEANRYFIDNFLPVLESETTMAVKKYCFTGANFEREKLNEILESLRTASGDAIFFYYTGHGYNPDSDDFPTLTLGLRSMPVPKRAMSLLNIYNTLRTKPHRLLLVMAEACNAVYGSRANSGDFKGSYDGFEGDYSNYQAIFGNSRGDYIMSSSMKGEKSYCPQGANLGYFTRAFRDALEERREALTMSEFLNDVAKKATKYADEYGGDKQHPQWLSGDYAHGASVKPTLQVDPTGEFTGIKMVDGGDDLVFTLTFKVKNMKGRKGRAVVYFFDQDGNGLKDTNSSYNTTAGTVCAIKDINPAHDPITYYNDLEIRIPKSELHQTGSHQRTLQYSASIWDYSANPHKELFQYNSVYFTFIPKQIYLKIDGFDSDINYNHYPGAESGFYTFRVDTNADDYEIVSKPGWIEYKHKTSNSFKMYCESNDSYEQRDGTIVVKAGDIKRKIFVIQSGMTRPSAEIEKVWAERVLNYGNCVGANIFVNFDINGLKGKKCKVWALFYQHDNRTRLTDIYGFDVSYSRAEKVPYDETTFTRLNIRVPFDGTNLLGIFGNYTYDIVITDEEGNELARKSNNWFNL